MKACFNLVGLLSLSVAIIAGSRVLSPARASAQSSAEARNDEEGPPLRSGLVATYRSHDKSAPIVRRVDAKPALTLTEKSVHWRLPEGRFAVHWIGYVLWRESEPVHFAAHVRGTVRVRLRGDVVLEVASDDEAYHLSNIAVQGEAGYLPVEIEYESPANGPGRLQLWWQSNAFHAEPIPAWNFSHSTDQQGTDLQADQELESARDLSVRYGCARCHVSQFRDDFAPRPGPSLANARGRLAPDWLRQWLAAPDTARHQARMPRLFTDDRDGFVERWVIAEYLGADFGRNAATRPATSEPTAKAAPVGDHRTGRRMFVGYGCATCHFMPDQDLAEQLDAGQATFDSLGDRWDQASLAAFLMNPRARYADDRMPSLPLTEAHAQDVAAFLLLWSPVKALPNEAPPTDAELTRLRARWKVDGGGDLAAVLLRAKRCSACHDGLEEAATAIDEVRLELGKAGTNCLDLAVQEPGGSESRDGATKAIGGLSAPRFPLDAGQVASLRRYVAVDATQRHSSDFDTRQRQIGWLGCAKCHQRDTDQAPAIERIGATFGGSLLQRLPYQRTPRLTFAIQKFESTHLLEAVGKGVTGLRHSEFSYRMPSFGDRSTDILRGLAESDGESMTPDGQLAARPVSQGTNADPTAASLFGPELVGFQGYACVSCHVWGGRMFADPDPGAVGPDLLRTAGRIRGEWFERFVENTLRVCPNTPMPTVFPRGRPALLSHILDADAARQREAIWNYLALGQAAPPPKAAPPMVIPVPARGSPILVAQIPLHITSDQVTESLCLLNDQRTMAVYDLGRGVLRRVVAGASIAREVQGRRRRFLLQSAETGPWDEEFGSWKLAESASDRVGSVGVVHFLGYDRRGNGARLRLELTFDRHSIRIDETVRLVGGETSTRIERDWSISGLPDGSRLILPLHGFPAVVDLTATRGRVQGLSASAIPELTFTADSEGRVVASLQSEPIPARDAAPAPRGVLPDIGRPTGDLSRPGYRAVEFPLPRAATGEDAVMPTAIAITADKGRVFVASTKLGELFELEQPLSDPSTARLKDYAHGLYQEAYSMLAVNDTLYVLHRRNLTAVRDEDGDGLADRFDRVLGLPHSIADAYDYAYGLARDAQGRFVFGYAPYASRQMVGSGGAVRFDPNSKTVEGLAYGMRNPVGWCADDRGEVYFTDNQGEWVATNKLCHVDRGLYYGFPNPEQRQHADRTRGRTAIWVPYAWAHSINGVTFDSTEGRFGPFAGQFFLAELMYGGAIVRASLEQVNGQYQGVCFPFWGGGLLGPVTMAFHPRGPLFVGGITEPGWMAQPDRGGLFRIDYTGEMPFEMRTIRVRPDGYRIVFTRPVDRATAEDPASYAMEQFRYEMTGSYGSPELDRTRVEVKSALVSEDGTSVDLATDPLVVDRVYMIHASRVRSAMGEPLVQPTGAYTLQEVPNQ